MNIVIIKKQDNDIRIDRWFKRYYPNIPFTLIVKLLRKKIIKLDNKKILPATKITTGQNLTFPCFDDNIKPDTPRTYSTKQQELGKLLQDAVIYKDENIIAINKPYNLAVQGGSKIINSIDYLAEFLQFDCLEKPKLVHRLDKETTGVLLLARTTQAAAKISELIRNHEIEKNYLAITQGIPKSNSDTISEAILNKHGVLQDAITHYKLLKSNNNIALIQFSIVTGRMHQIRHHSKILECPILGDKKYNKNAGKNDKLHLHAHEMKFTLYNKEIKITAEIPQDFCKLL